MNDLVAVLCVEDVFGIVRSTVWRKTVDGAVAMWIHRRGREEGREAHAMSLLFRSCVLWLSCGPLAPIDNEW